MITIVTWCFVFQIAGVVGNLVQISLSLLFYLQVYLEDEVDPGVFWGLALLSPCAFAFAIDKVMKEQVGGKPGQGEQVTGSHWSVL